MMLFSSVAFTTIASLVATTVSAHSWIEEFQVVSSNGSYIGDRGYSRGYMARTDPGYNGFSMMNLVPQIGSRVNSSDFLCHPSQRISNYSNPAYPKLKVAPGEYVAMKYLENGHVTLPWNQEGKPPAAGTVFVYGTTAPSENETMVNVLQWTADGKGGNGKGWLMAAQNFDDGRCHQINCGNISTDRQILFPDHVYDQPTSSVEQWCETDLKIPENQAVGSLTTYWVWQWGTEANKDCTAPDGKDEYYTTCSDFDIIAPGSGTGDAKIAAEAATNTLLQQDPQSTAVSSFMSRTAYTTSPAIVFVSGTRTISMQTTASPAFLSSCAYSISNSISATPKVDVPTSCPVISIFSGPVASSAFEAAVNFATTPNIGAAVSTDNAAPTEASSTAMLTSASAPAPYTSQTAPVILGALTVTETTIQITTETTTLTTSAVTFATMSGSPSTSAVMIAASSGPANDSSSVSKVIASGSELSFTQTPLSTGSAAAATLSGSSDVLPTIMTVSGSGPAYSAGQPPLSAIPSTSSTNVAMSSAVTSAGAPHVGANGLVDDVIVAINNPIAIEHDARRAVRRHARQFGLT